MKLQNMMYHIIVQEIKEKFESLEGSRVTIAEDHVKETDGKSIICNIKGSAGNIQSYVARDSIGEESYAEFKKYDVGDIVGLEGEVFKTKTGEISMQIRSFF